MKKFLPVIICLLLLLPASVSAVKLYKWVDADGKVTYQELPPPADARKVEEKDIDPDLNIAQPYHPIGGETSSSEPRYVQQHSAGQTDAGAKEPQSAPLLQGNGIPSQGVNPFPVREPPPVAAPPPVIAPPPVPAPPPVRRSDLYAGLSIF